MRRDALSRFRLHTDLFVDLPSELFMGVMALLFVIAIVSGIVPV